MRNLNIYQKNKIEHEVLTSNKAEIVSLLNEKVAEFLNHAIFHIQNNNVSLKLENIQKSLNIIEQGLLASLDSTIQNNLVTDLKKMYVSSMLTIIKANIENNIKDLKTIADIYLDMKNVWLEISINA